MVDISVPDFQSDERGVSPVIGVILMVAITVILAAVIGAFVLDLGSQLGSTGPQTQLAVTDHSDDFSASDGSLQTAFVLEHKGGDELKSGDLRIIVEKGGSTVGTFSASTSPAWTVQSSDSGTDGPDQVVKTLTSTGGTVPSSSTLSVGSSWVIEETVDQGTTTSVITEGEYTVKVVHKPSNSVVATQTVELS